MKVLWIINLPLPEASILMNDNPSPLGGWLVNASRDIAEKEGMELSVAFPKKGVQELLRVKGRKINYYAFKPVKDRDRKIMEYNPLFKKILEETRPDVIHIFGTELAHALSMVNTAERAKINVIISVQGLVSVIARHVYTGLPWRAVYGATIRNILMGDNVAGLKRLYERRGKNETEALKKVGHIIGRTTMDKAYTSLMNPQARYHFCNETLREAFYRHKWNQEQCERHSIFVSQSQPPIKGLHHLLEAMPLIVSRYPDARLFISGKDISGAGAYKDRLMITYYGKYIRKLIRKYQLQEHIVFTGFLDEKKMCERYLKSNVFVCPSSIENSPNSLGEAMILGVPCVASDVGGVQDMMVHKEEGFVYQADAPYMLAHYVCEIFENQSLAEGFSEKARAHAMKTHDRKENTARMLEIYAEVMEQADI